MEVCRQRQERNISLSCWGRNVKLPESPSRLPGLAACPALTLLRTEGCFRWDGLLCARLIPGRTQSFQGPCFATATHRLFPSSDLARKARGKERVVTDGDPPHTAPTPATALRPPTSNKLDPLPGPHAWGAAGERRRRREERFHLLSASRADSLDSSFRGTNFILRQTDRPEL